MSVEINEFKNIKLIRTAPQVQGALFDGYIYFTIFQTAACALTMYISEEIQIADMPLLSKHSFN